MANMNVTTWLAVLVFFISFCDASDSLIPGDSLRNNETLVSPGRVFELGFFGTGGSSTNHYLGIWFKNDRYKKAVWVANRENPILDSSGILSIRYDGNMVITDIRQIPIIVNYGTVATSSNTTARILDSGNLVLIEGENILWQSFDYPSDTFLLGMKLGFFDLDTDHVRCQFLASWLSPFVPATGAFALGLDSNNRTLVNIWRRYRVFVGHIGFGDGHSFKFFFQTMSDSSNYTFVSNSKEMYLTFDTKGKKMTWLTLSSTGEINVLTMLD